MMRMSARGAITVASKAKKLRNFGKAWKVGDKGIVLYPLFKNEETGEPELLVAATWGYKVNDMNLLGIKATFIPSNAEINENGEPDVPDVTSQFSRLAPAFIAGEKEAKINAANNKNWPSPQSLRTALEQIERDYDVKNNPKAKKAIISRLQMYISTEVIYIPIVQDKPDWANAGLYSQSLSNERINKLYAIMSDKKYAITGDSRFMEVQYDFIAADGEKSTAGKCQPVGQPPEYMLKSRFPDDAAKFDALVDQLPTESKLIMNHNYSYRKISEATLRSAFSNYSIINSDALNTVPDDYHDSVVHAASLIEELSLKQSITNEKLIADIDAELAKRATEAPIKPTPTAAVSSGAPTINDLMSNPARADASEQEDLDNVSLD